MLKLVSPIEMKQLDEAAIEKARVPGLILMENAAMAITSKIMAHIQAEELAAPRVLILSGTGNNGGDGFAVARQLALEHIHPQVVLLGQEKKLKGDALVNWEILQHRDDIDTLVINPKSSTCEEELSYLSAYIREADIIVDALLGTGITGAPKSPMDRVIQDVNQERNPLSWVISVDIPSGVAGATGNVETDAVQADMTVSMALPKTGLVFYPGAEYAGQLSCVPIGIPGHLMKDHIQTHHYLVTHESAANLIPQRRPHVHKGHLGKILAIAGSRHMMGAGALTAGGALKTGSGLVTLAVPDSESGTAQAKVSAGVMTAELPSHAGYLGADAPREALEIIGRTDAAAVGPGLGRGAPVFRMVEQLLAESQVPLVLDADALNVLEGKAEILASARSPVIITPHVGEFARLTGESIQRIKERLIDTVKSYASKWRVTIVLKGAPSLIASPDGYVFVNRSGNAGMATGGSGDVLTGMVVSLVGQGLDHETAAVVGVYLHGLAGDLAAQNLGQESMTAPDIIEYISEAYRELSKY